MVKVVLQNGEIIKINVPQSLVNDKKELLNYIKKVINICYDIKTFSYYYF